MTKIQSPLDKLEANLQKMIEGNLARLFPSDEFQKDFIHKISEAIIDSMNSKELQNELQPNQFNIMLNPSQAAYLKNDTGFINELCDLIVKAGVDTGLNFLSYPAIRIIEDSTINSQEVKISSSYNLNEISQTNEYNLKIEKTTGESQLPMNAFLIVDGMSIFHCDRNIINIGRRADNHLVLKDKRVSRKHAQIRTVNGRYVIFDLNSTGGTYLNGIRINQEILRPGDVISLSGLPLVYGHDTLENGDTQKYSIESSETGGELNRDSEASMSNREGQ